MNPATVKRQSERSSKFLALSGGRRIAYHVTEGRLPGIAFLGGFHSDMTGAKAMALEAFAAARGQRFLRFDYTGHGQSSGRFEDGAIGQWKQDAVETLAQLMPDDTVLVGSSMGAWLMLLVALERRQKISALVGVASAPDFTENLIWQQLTPAQKTQMAEEGRIFMPSCYGEAPYPITRALLEEGRNHLLLNADIALTMPVRLIHGTRDQDVPWQTSVTLMERLASADVRLTLVKGGDHRLSNPAQLAVLCQALEGVLPG